MAVHQYSKMLISHLLALLFLVAAYHSKVLGLRRPAARLLDLLSPSTNLARSESPLDQGSACLNCQELSSLPSHSSLVADATTARVATISKVTSMGSVLA